MTRVGIVGASGYSGLELIKILLNHPESEIIFVTGTERVAGQKIQELFPVLRGQIDLDLATTNVNDIINADVDFIFMATPNETSLELIPTIVKESNKKIIDLSGSFRLKNNSLYKQYYGFENDNTDILREFVYGLPELNKEEIRKSRLIASPGCYPTSVLLPMIPLLKSKLLNVSQRVIIDSKSGVSGAGRKPTETTHYVEINESLKAYNLHRHRHEPEIVQELSKSASVDIKVTFSPHLVPLTRGILSTIYAEAVDGVRPDDILSVWVNAYHNDKFIRILAEGELPEIKYVAHTHYCDIGFSMRKEEIIIVSCIDNLLKGASSQAIQNYNLMNGFKEDLGL